VFIEKAELGGCAEKETADPSSQSARHGGQARDADFRMTTKIQKQK